MIDLAIISGSGFYDLGLDNVTNKLIKTRYGDVEIKIGTVHDKRIAFISRHGKGHKILPNMINYRANLLALKELETKAIIATTVCGVLDEDIHLAKLIIFDDLYFPDNRLPSGELCSIYSKIGDKKRGHFLFDTPFCKGLMQQLTKISDNPVTGAVYAHVNGLRFNSKSEIKMLRNYASCISQTAGPEIVLAGELEIPYVLLGIGIDYANGIKEKPTPTTVLNKNLEISKRIFTEVIHKFIKDYNQPNFEGFVYRFEQS